MHYDSLMQRRAAKAAMFIIFEKQGVTMTQLTKRFSFLSAKARKALFDHVLSFCTLEQSLVSELGRPATVVRITHAQAQAAIAAAGSIKHD